MKGSTDEEPVSDFEQTRVGNASMLGVLGDCGWKFAKKQAATWKTWADKLIEGEPNDERKCEEVRSPELFMHDNVRKILQRAV